MKSMQSGRNPGSPSVPLARLLCSVPLLYLSMSSDWLSLLTVTWQKGCGSDPQEQLLFSIPMASMLSLVQLESDAVLITLFVLILYYLPEESYI